MKRFMNKEIPQNIKLCIHCKYFIGHWHDSPDKVIDHDKYGKCKLFGKISIITGKTEYDYAKIIRNNNSLCGENGKLFVKI